MQSCVQNLQMHWANGPQTQGQPYYSKWVKYAAIHVIDTCCSRIDLGVSDRGAQPLGHGVGCVERRLSSRAGRGRHAADRTSPPSRPHNFRHVARRHWRTMRSTYTQLCTHARTHVLWEIFTQKHRWLCAYLCRACPSDPIETACACRLRPLLSLALYKSN